MAACRQGSGAVPGLGRASETCRVGSERLEVKVVMGLGGREEACLSRKAGRRATVGTCEGLLQR